MGKEKSSAILNRRHPIPLYYQLVEYIRDEIHSGNLEPGDQLPSERELSEQAGISRMTARQAIAFLDREGTVVVKPGIGTFVAEAKLVHDTLHLFGFTEEMVRQGEAVSSQVLEQDLVVPPPYVAGELQMPSGELAVKLVRLRLSADLPLLLETSYVPARLCPGLENMKLEAQSLYALFEQRYELRLESTRQTIEATIANEYEAELFHVEPGTAMILLEGVTYAEPELPVEYVKAIYRGDRFKFELVRHKRGLAQEVPGTRRVSVLMDA